MAQQLNLTNEQRRRAVVEKMWLSYFNNTLLEKGVITQDQHRKIQVRINSRKPTGMER